MAGHLGTIASVLGIIGFAGQIMQGCQIASAFFNQIKDAPDDFRCFIEF